MTSLPPVHICVVQPVGYVHALGFLDQARYLRHQFRRFGAQVTIAKNRLHHGAVNFVLGAHLGFDPDLRQRYSCIFLNLEQMARMGEGGASVPLAYRDLLRSSAVVDYDAANVAAYASHPDDVPVVPLLHAPYLMPAQPLPLAERPIDLLFIGSMNPRRQAMIAQIEALGVPVTVFDSPLYGPERDVWIQQAKAVYNTPFYEGNRFEQARVSHCLSLGTPVISERSAHTLPHPAFEDCVSWVDDQNRAAFFSTHFLSEAYFSEAEAQVLRFTEADPMEAYADLLAFAVGFARGHQGQRPEGPWRPRGINLGSGKDYKPGWLNLDVVERAQPDLLLDLAQPLPLPLQVCTPSTGPLRLEEASVDIINANNVLEHVPDLVSLMGNCLKLLKVGGVMQIEVPYERANAAWQDPTHVRAMNENSWVYYTDWFWYLGWFEHRFAVTASCFLDLNLQPCGKDNASFMKMSLTKVETSLQERMTARTYQTDLHLPDDEVLCWQPDLGDDVTQSDMPALALPSLA